MADPQRGDEFPEDEDEGGGGESTVSMASPQLDPAVPLPISVPPPPMPAAGAAPMPNLSMPTAPTPFTPQSPPAFPMSGPGGKPPSGPNPSVPTPFGGIAPSGPGGPGAPGGIPKPLPAAGAPVGKPPPNFAAPAPAAAPQREMVTSSEGAGGIAGIKRPQTVIGLAPPPAGAPRPGQAGARVPLPSGKAPASSAGAPRPAAGAPAAPPPSSGRGVLSPAAKATGSSPKHTDADSTDQQPAVSRDSIPDSQKEDMATMAKSPEESLALFGLDGGPGAAAPANASPKPPPAAGAPPSNRSPLASTSLSQNKPLVPPSSKPGLPVAPPLPIGDAAASIADVAPVELPVLHDRTEEEESTRAVSREEMLRGHDAVIIGEDGEGAQGEDATLAVAPGFNENAKHLHELQQQYAREQAQPFGPPQPGFGGPALPHGATLQSAQQPWQDPNAQHHQMPPQQQPWQDPNAYGMQGAPVGPQSYPGGMSVGPVSGPHMPAQSWTPNAPPSQPHFPGAQPHGNMGPQSNPHLQVPQSGHMMASGNPNQPIPYPGQQMQHQPPNNPFGEWNANAPPPQQQGGLKLPFKLSGQVLLLAIVGAVCLAIFITGIVLFATTKF